jgi:ectoine hydroxylase-related dioxygenase (phytanoyl-CoA dioxygenase family)
MQADEKLLAQLRETGLAVVPQVLPRQEALAIRPLLEAAIFEDIERWENKPGYIDHWMVHNLMVRGEPFLRFLENPTLHAYLSPILGDTCIVYAYTSSSMPPKGSNFSRRIHVDCPRVIPGFPTNLGVMLALDDFTQENGPTEMLPCSQWRTDEPTEAEFSANRVLVFPKAGDAVFFNARTWHRGGVNQTDKPRHAITLNVCRSFMRQRFDYPRLVPEELVRRLGPVGQRFLGFNVRVPSSLDEYYVPEEERLYKRAQG